MNSKRYQVALSFASEQRSYVDQVAATLRTEGIQLFYDDHQRIDLWGKNLGEELQRIYMHDSDTVVMFISSDYAKKAWTIHERRSTLSRALSERREYVLPVRFDETVLPGLDPHLHYLRTADYSPLALANNIIRKLRTLRIGSQSWSNRLGGIELASEYVKELLQESPTRFPAIDDGICLHDSVIPLNDIKLDISRVLGTNYDGLRPTRSQLAAILDGAQWDNRVIDHLRGQLPSDVDSQTSQWKLGVHRIVAAAPEQGQALTIELEPQLWWIEREFNRKLLKATAPSDLQQLGKALAMRFLNEDNDAGSFKYRFPSDFYVEVAVVGNDDKVLLLDKNPGRGSHMAQRGLPRTCSVEEGAKVTDISDGMLSGKDVIERGLVEELKIENRAVDRIDLYAIALQARHLNTALLGVARLNVPADQLADRAKNRELPDFIWGAAVAPDSMDDLLEGDDSTNMWHATARLRLVLAMRQLGC